MRPKITAQVGQIIEVNGKQYRATADGFEPVMQRGTLGGELVEVGSCQPNQMVHYYGRSDTLHLGQTHGETLVETNITPRPTLTPMTAGEAAKLPGIVGQWVAVQVDKVRVQGIESQNSWFGCDDQILLIEGVDL